MFCVCIYIYFLLQLCKIAMVLLTFFSKVYLLDYEKDFYPLIDLDFRLFTYQFMDRRCVPLFIYYYYFFATDQTDYEFLNISVYFETSLETRKRHAI